MSRWGESLDIINTIKSEGHAVKMFIEDKASKEIGFGFVNKIASELRSKGKLVIGGTEYTYKLKLDRNFGQSELQKHKIKVIPSEEFTSFNDAIHYIKAHPNTYVIKPCGET